MTPLDSWDENLVNLNYVLAGLYPLTADSLRIVDNAQLNKAFIAFQPRGIDNWNAILNEAIKRGKILNIIQAARRDFPEDPFLKRAEQGKLTTVRGPILDEDIQWKGEEPSASLEKIMGQQSTLLPIAFLEIGVKCALSVARVRRSDGALGSGFLIKNNLFVTNNHVLHNEGEASTAVIQFNYQQTASGLDLEPASFQLDPGLGFATSAEKENDWTVVKVRGDANAKWGSIDIQQLDIKDTQWVNIIQHPGGGPKQIAMYHNLVAYVDETRVQYLTDTLPGSSGSPVFNSQWLLVALHHSGGWITEPGTKKHVFRNEGINVNCIINGLEGSGLI